MRAATPLDQPRAIGAVSVSSKLGPYGSCLDGLRQSGALKLLFPKRQQRVEGIVINTAGGITGGDQFDLRATAGPGSHLTLSTQAAERAYRAQPGQTGRITTHLAARENSTLHWLPQETIVFDEARLARRLKVDLAPSARFLMVEPILFGRRAMGEELRSIAFTDRIEILRGGVLLYRDGLSLTGDVAAQMDRPGIGNGARAMASVVWVAPQAANKLATVRTILGEKGGASLLGEDTMVMRLLAGDGFELRRSLLPILDMLTDNTLPQSWRL